MSFSHLFGSVGREQRPGADECSYERAAWAKVFTGYFRVLLAPLSGVQFGPSSVAARVKTSLTVIATHFAG
ncbi:hypothetical protein [Desulfitobacterium dichloroeliminans]|uniref:hypothetical protein n=1 Tax=Desulfitobacterium dichloroeliminans TaxID=233055 RepID=UPI00155AFB49|nr:hypothetical protein [Desulfitobacterium dichloroeliminans]